MSECVLEEDGLLGAEPAYSQLRPWRLSLGLVLACAALAAVVLAMTRHVGAASVATASHRTTNFAEFQEPEIYKSESQGLGMWYDPGAWGAETCGYHSEWSPPGIMGVVALNVEDFNAGGKMRGCGMCIKAWANGDYGWNGKSGGGSLPMAWNGETFFVTTACAGCSAKGVAFALQPGQGDNPGPSGYGQWDIRWQGVPCPTDDGPDGKGKSPLYMLDSGPNQHWIKVRPMNLHYPVVSMAFQEHGEYKEGRLGPQTWFEWRPFGFEWQPTEGEAAPVPLQIRFTMATGEVLYDELPKLDRWVEGSRGKTDTQ